MNLRAAVLAALVVLACAPLLAVLLSDPTEAQPGREAEYEFILKETERTDRGGRNHRQSLGLYRYRDYKYAEARYTLLERYLFDVKEDLGIHNLLARGFRLVDVEHGAAGTTFVVRISAGDFDALTRHLR
jgi:hypothetical protein